MFFCSSGFSQETNLSGDPQWLALLHFENGGPSKIQPSKFFISEDGYRNPEAELVATIASLKDPSSETRCLFPARYEWLASKLPEISNLPKQNCADLDTWFSAINPSRSTLIFASTFVNNPASAFGHTFLRIDQENSEDLLAYSANYAAETQGEDALTYAIKGIFGGYDGYFSIMPYYQKVKDYSDLENRDIWEYQLALDKDEIRRMVLHLWELRKMPASYYYFDENCSYKMIELIMVARPALKLDQQFPGWVIPVDTVRALKDLIITIKFRPSAQTLLKNRITHANPEQKNRSMQIADVNQSLNLDKEDAESLDLAYELITYRKIAGSLAEAEANKRAFQILAARGANPKVDAVPTPATPTVRPEQGHESAQLSIEEGRQHGLWFSRLAIRPAFHDLLDPQPGYQNGSQINFFEFALDATENQGLDLGYFTALDITSLVPRSEFFSPLSWNVRTGFKRVMIEDRDDSLTPFLGASFGRSYTTIKDGLFYTLIDSEVRANKHYDSDFNPGAGIRFGILNSFNDNWKFNAEVQWLRFVEQTSLDSSYTLAYAIGVNANIFAKIAQENEYNRGSTTGTLGYEFYF